MTKTSKLEKQMDTLVHDAKSANSRVHNTFNDFLMLANTQFIENVSKTLSVFIYSMQCKNSLRCWSRRYHFQYRLYYSLQEMSSEKHPKYTLLCILFSADMEHCTIEWHSRDVENCGSSPDSACSHNSLNLNGLSFGWQSSPYVIQMPDFSTFWSKSQIRHPKCC